MIEPVPSRAAVLSLPLSVFTLGAVSHYLKLRVFRDAVRLLSDSQTSQINDASCVAFKVPNDRPTLQCTHHSTESSALPYYSLFSLPLSLSVSIVFFLSSLSHQTAKSIRVPCFLTTLFLFSLVRATKRDSSLLPSDSLFCPSLSLSLPPPPSRNRISINPSHAHLLCVTRSCVNILSVHEMCRRTPDESKKWNETRENDA